MIERITLSPKVNLAAGTIAIDKMSRVDGVWFDVEFDMASRREAWVINTRDKMIRDALICLGWRPPAERLTQIKSDKCVADEAIRRVRAHDPSTSVAAAERAATFALSHCDRILEALNGPKLSTKEIETKTGLTVVQIARRLTELRRDGRVEVVQASDGQGGTCDLERDGCRVWRRL